MPHSVRQNRQPTHQQPGERAHPLNRDADHLCQRLIVGKRPHLSPKSSKVDEQVENHQTNAGGHTPKEEVGQCDF